MVPVKMELGNWNRLLGSVAKTNPKINQIALEIYASSIVGRDSKWQVLGGQDSDNGEIEYLGCAE